MIPYNLIRNLPKLASIAFLSLTLSLPVPAAEPTDALLLQKGQSYLEEAIRIRRILHQCPEPCYQETKTSEFLAEYLKQMGLEVQTGIAGTGMKVVLRGKAARPVIGIRADMDALPITEQTGLPFSSRNDGFMHACGHDVHMTNGLIAARILSDIKDRIPGTVVFFFQPCEEGSLQGMSSGAQRMMEAGALENPKVEAMVGLHVLPAIPVGSVASREGPIMASVDSLSITLKGKASHGAFPHEGIDAIYAAATAIQQFQSLISRFKNPKESAVLTIGTIQGGVRRNVLAETVHMEGTVRTFSADTQEKIKEGMARILKGLDVSMGTSHDFQYHMGHRFVKNDTDLTRRVTGAFRRLLGETHVLPTDPLTIGEDFSEYSHSIPSCFFFLGTGKAEALHSSTFSVEEEMLRYGPVTLAAAALEAMEQNQSTD